MKRTNEFEVVPQSDADEDCFDGTLDASAALWNEINYQRRTNFEDPDGDVWEIDEYRGRYGGTLGASTVQQIERKNRSFFALRKGEANGKPGFWGNADAPNGQFLSAKTFEDPDGDVWRRVPRTVRRYARRANRSADRTQEPRSVALVLLANKARLKTRVANCGRTSETRRTRSNGANTLGSRFLSAKT